MWAGSFGAIVPDTQEQLDPISAWIAIALLLVYVANVAYTLMASRAARARRPAQVDEAAVAVHDAHHAPEWSPKKAVIVLAAVSLGIIWLSEILVGAVEPASEELGLSDAFTGVFVLAVIGGAAEQATAIVAARQNRIDGTQLLNERKYDAAMKKLGDAMAEAEKLDDGWLQGITETNIGYG